MSFFQPMRLISALLVFWTANLAAAQPVERVSASVLLERPIVAPIPAAHGAWESAPLAAAEPDSAEPAPIAGDDASVPAGIVRHGEHWADLILSQGGAQDPRYFRAYQALARTLLAQAKAGNIPLVNEKIDGSPSIVIGFDAENRPFVTYKGDLSKVRGPQRLVTSEEDAKRYFKNLAPLYSTAIKLLGERLRALPKEQFSDYLFQADLLFYEDPAAKEQGRKQAVGDKIVIAANSIAYEVGKDHPYYEPLSQAKIGLVIHTVGRKKIDEEGRVRVLPASEAETAGKIEKLVAGLNSSAVFAVHPWKTDVAVGREKPLAAETAEKISSLLSGIEKKLAALPPEFKEDWAARHEARFRIFFNSQVRPPHNGGFYAAAARGDVFSMEKLLEGYGTWLKERATPREKLDAKTGEVTSKALETPGYVKAVARLLVERKDELARLLEAYYDAVRVQYLIQPSISEIFRSKLGGGESEGVMLRTEDTLVKLVDRLGFTLKNNARWNRGAATPLHEPYDQWRPGAAFVLMKGQPVHSGHIRMIQQAVMQNTGGPVFVVVSDKKPNLEAEDWKGLKIAKTKKELAAGAYTYVFSPELRRRILEASLGAGAKIYFLDTNEFWRYLDGAKARGETAKIKLVVGEKEIAERRYDAQFQFYAGQLEPLAVAMQENGLSATAVRQALRDYTGKDSAAKKKAEKTLRAALAAVPSAAEREAILKTMVSEWKAVDKIVRRLLASK